MTHALQRILRLASQEKMSISMEFNNVNVKLGTLLSEEEALSKSQADEVALQPGDAEVLSKFIHRIQQEEENLKIKIDEAQLETEHVLEALKDKMLEEKRLKYLLQKELYAQYLEDLKREQGHLDEWVMRSERLKASVP